MINPSASGWIDKFFLKQKNSLLPTITHPNTFYKKVRETGFIYGHIVAFDTPFSINTKGWLQNEISKVALLNTLYSIYELTAQENIPEKFIDDLFNGMFENNNAFEPSTAFGYTILY